MQFQFRPNIFLKESALFSLTMALGLWVAYRYVSIASGALILQTPAFSYGDAIALAVIITFFVFMTKFRRLARIVFWTFMVLMILGGTQIIIEAFAGFPWDLAGSALILILFFAWRNVLMHDLAVMLALAGICALLGTTITPTLGIIALLVLSFYDIIAVYKTRHMVRLAEGMIQSGAIFGFVIPSESSSFLAHRGQAQAQVGNQFMVLGSGDIGLPLIFAASLMRQSLLEAIIVGIFAVAGVLLTHLLFINQRQRQAMAALPPIATMCLIGYIVALLLRL